MKIPVALGAFLSGSVGNLAKTVLSSLGMGVISFAAISTALNQLLGIAQANYAGVGGYAAAFLGLAGVGTGLGIISGALIFRAALLALPKLGMLSK